MLRQALEKLLPTILTETNALEPTKRYLAMPPGLSEQQVYDFVTSVRVEGAPKSEMRAYAT